MRTLILPACLAVLSPFAAAEVRELGGAEMVDTYIEGISVGQEVTDTGFATDDQALRETTADQQALHAGVTGGDLMLDTALSLDVRPELHDLVAAIDNRKTRDLVEDAITQTGSGAQFDLNVQRANATNALLDNSAPPAVGGFSNRLLDLLPSGTGYQLEFSPGR